MQESSLKYTNINKLSYDNKPMRCFFALEKRAGEAIHHLRKASVLLTPRRFSAILTIREAVGI